MGTSCTSVFPWLLAYRWQQLWRVSFPCLDLGKSSHVCSLCGDNRGGASCGDIYPHRPTEAHGESQLLWESKHHPCHAEASSQSSHGCHGHAAASGT